MYLLKTTGLPVSIVGTWLLCSWTLPQLRLSIRLQREAFVRCVRPGVSSTVLAALYRSFVIMSCRSHVWLERRSIRFQILSPVQCTTCAA
jgi:hypothetical protein